MSQVFLPCLPLEYGPGRDPYWSSVVLLLHAEGTNGSTTLTDSSPSPKTVTASSTCAISTARFKFGASSILGGATGYFTAALGTSGNMTGDFTWESWVYGGTNGFVFWSGTDGSNYRSLFNDFFEKWVGGVRTINLGLTSNLAVGWHHLALSRTGSALKGFTNGVQIGSVTDSSTIDLQTLVCGKYVPSGSGFWMQNYDEMRITKGVGRYPAAFTPPARRFPDS